MNREPTFIPGFFDLQVNGYLGVDFSAPELTEDRFVDACRALIKAGTYAFLPTIITSPPEVYQKNLGIIKRVIDWPEFKAHLPGIHLEGPFISGADGARGAHARPWVQSPDPEVLDQLIRWSKGNIRLLTVAAELPGAAALCRHACRRGIRVSLGHQLANYEQIFRMVSAGASAMTHLGNGLPHLVDRHDNPLLSGLGIDELQAMIIADGFHLPVPLLRLILRLKGSTRTILVSDQAPVAGLPPGKYRTLGNEVELAPSGRLYNPETGYLVGSSFTLLKCANYLLGEKLATVEEVIRMAYYHPLTWLGLEAKKMPPGGGSQLYIDSSVFLVEE